MRKHLPPGTLVSDLDPYSDAMLENPTGFHELLLGDSPLVFLDRYNVFAVGRHDTVREALRNWQALISSAGVGLADRRTDPMWRTQSPLIEADPPQHSARRAVLNRLFSPRALSAFQALFDDVAEAVVDEVLQAGSADGVRDIAEAYPVKVFILALGLPGAIAPHLVTYGEVAFNALGPLNDRARSALTGSAESIAAVEQMTRARDLAPGSLGARMWQAADVGEIAADETPVLIRSVLGAGIDTTVAALASALYHLATDPAQWALLAADPSLAKAAFEEAIRVDSPAQMFYRLAAAPVELPGPAHLPAGSRVLLGLGAANRDSRVYRDPGRYDLSRKPSGHVGFGVGIHACVGMHLARLEGRSLLSALARKAGALTLTGDPARALNNTLRSWGRLPMSLEPRTTPKPPARGPAVQAEGVGAESGDTAW
jgi:cytochrome P450